MCWIVIYLVDSIIHLLNNQGQCSKLKLQVIQEAEHKLWNMLIVLVDVTYAVAKFRPERELVPWFKYLCQFQILS